MKHPPLDLTASAFLVTAKVGQRARASFQGHELEGLLVRASSTHVTLRMDDGTMLTLLPRTHAFVWPV